MLNILIANDDGITAAGIRALADALSEKANIYICAPDSQRSAAGHGITMKKPVYAEEVEFEGAEKAYAISGTPADCVKLGLKLLAKDGIKIDMVYSGINMGSNVGTDIIYSGTVAAAVEGAINKIPSVAVSVDSHEAVHFDLACELAVNVLENAYDEMDPSVIININTPDLPKDEIKGVKFTKMGIREYYERFDETIDENGKVQYWYGGDRVMYDGAHTDIDVIANQENYASISPIHFDLTAYNYLDKIKDWGIK